MKILPAMAAGSPERPKMLPQDRSNYYELVHIGQAPSRADGGSPQRWPRAWPRKPAKAIAAVARSASIGATLTPDDVAISRADGATRRLDAMIEQMRRDGSLRGFNAAYKRHARRRWQMVEGL